MNKKIFITIVMSIAIIIGVRANLPRAVYTVVNNYMEGTSLLGDGTITDMLESLENKLNEKYEHFNPKVLYDNDNKLIKVVCSSKALDSAFDNALYIKDMNTQLRSILDSIETLLYSVQSSLNRIGLDYSIILEIMDTRDNSILYIGE